MLSNCSDGSGEVMVGDVITVETDANPSVSEFHWKVNGEEFSTSDSISLGEDMIGQQVDVSCVVVNVMMGDVKGNDTASCVYTLQGILYKFVQAPTCLIKPLTPTALATCAWYGHGT